MYDAKKADRAVNFISNLKHTKGKFWGRDLDFGSLVKAGLWQIIPTSDSLVAAWVSVYEPPLTP